MASEKRLVTFNVLALLCAIWFLLFGWFWTFLINVIFVFPFAIAGFFLWRKGRESEKKQLNKITGWLLLAGVVTSIGTLIAFIVFN